MGKREADADGIKYYYDPEVGARGCKGATIYLVPCSKCGGEIRSLTYGRNHEYVCDKCRAGVRKQNETLERELLIELTTDGERRFAKAVQEIKKQVKDFQSYRRVIGIARKAQDKYGSVPEAMVAIELLKLGYKIIPQQQIGKYKVDFYLPNVKTVVEVDGRIYHQGRDDNEREATIMLSLGLDTRIVHIPAERIAKDISKLKQCLDELP